MSGTFKSALKDPVSSPNFLAIGLFTTDWFNFWPVNVFRDKFYTFSRSSVQLNGFVAQVTGKKGRVLSPLRRKAQNFGYKEMGPDVCLPHQPPRHQDWAKGPK